MFDQDCAITLKIMSCWLVIMHFHYNDVGDQLDKWKVCKMSLKADEQQS